MPPFEGPATLYFTEDACRQVAAEIADAGEVEVFFIGRREKSGLVHEVESRASGTANQVAAIMHTARPGDVIIHNHPTGELNPSEADMTISSQVGQQSIGSYIVNNDCSRCRVIVRPIDEKPTVAVDESDVMQPFARESALARAVGEFEDRPQQREMAAHVLRAFNDGGIAVVEAGTGTGKSFAYLIPAIMHAVRNKERIVISTNTINLQEQLLRKDIPAVQKALGAEFRVELVKGRSNYVCKRKASFAEQEMGFLVEPEFRTELKDTLEWAKTSETGDRGDLAVPPRSEVWERVESEADNCLRVRCPFYESCFFYNSRRRAARADLLIVNHSLLLSDLSVRRESENWTNAAVLPPYRRVVLDEAHHLEEVATRHLSREVTRPGLRRLFGRLYRTDGRGRAGAIAAFIDVVQTLTGRRVLDPSAPFVLKLVTELAPRVGDVRDTCDHLLEEFGSRLMEVARLEMPRRNAEHRVRLVPAITKSREWEESCVPLLRDLAACIVEFVSLNSEVLAGFRECDAKVLGPLTNAMMEWQALLGRVDERRKMVQAMLDTDLARCRWVELGMDQNNRLVVRLNIAPIDVGKLLRETLHEKMHSQAMTSATLTVESRFDFFLGRAGLGAPEAKPSDEESAEPAPHTEERVRTLRLSSPFHYAEQVFLGIPSDLGDPRGKDYEARIPDFITRAVAISDGRALVLFTSYAQLRRCHDICAPAIRRLGYECLRQGDEARDRLLNKFRDDETSVLFATSSFWEGIDVRGRALELVIVAKLPFSQPDEPIQQAQVEWLNARGRDAFDELIVPRAIVKFRQGFGRLIRSSTDRGAVLIADDRVMRMGYGRRFIDSLPECEARFRKSDVLFEEMRKFYSSPRGA